MAEPDRIELLYKNQEGPRYPGFTSTGQVAASPLPEGSRQLSTRIASPTFSASSIGSTRSSGTASSRKSSVSSAASSVTNIPPWQVQLPTLNQYLAMAPLQYGYDLPCEFGFLGCYLRFHPEHFEAWISHSTSHFCGRPPPAYAICTFCDDPAGHFRSQGDSNSNWRERMIHIGGHFQDLEREQGLRPDYRVIEYMHSNGLLSDDDYTNAMAYSERPPCDGLGLVPYGHKTQETMLKEERESRVVYNCTEERRAKRDKGKNAHQKSHHKSHQKPRTHRTVWIDSQSQ